MSRYRTFDHGDGTTITVTAATLPELFENAAFALFDLSFDLAGVAPTYSRPLVAPGDGMPELLVNWLTELILESERAGIAFSLFMVDRLEDGGLQGSASGMPLSAAVHRRSRVVGIDSAAEPEFTGDEWSVSFEVALGPRLRSV